MLKRYQFLILASTSLSCPLSAGGGKGPDRSFFVSPKTGLLATIPKKPLQNSARRRNNRKQLGAFGEIQHGGPVFLGADTIPQRSPKMKLPPG
jgi:hypothetical protein